ncbi:zinc finger SWIM domain-containing protein 7 isoform X2 [Patella vulgata]|nr:zinc finger SWIM domain-containing protein 7 isoform X2 [Patella vulgata]XP_050408212.1 zinc finger SWIM domain-containing protein 7 isoform X2 [Patella vulgata]
MNEVKKVYREHGKLTDEILSALQFVYQTPLLPALELIDNESVTLITSSNGRQVYQVVGSAGTRYYTCFTSSKYCSCPAYRFSVLKKEDYIMCKHVLAIELCKAMDLLKTNEISDKELSTIIQELE